MPSAAATKHSIKRRALAVLAAALIAAGAAALLFPTVEAVVYKAGVDGMKAEFASAVVAIDDPRKAELHALLEARNAAYFESGQEHFTSVDSYTVDDIDLTEFGLPDPDIIGYLDVPRLGVTLPIYLGASQEHLANGAGHLTETSYPIGGDNTNCVIAAHRGYSGKAMFREIEDLQIGDEMTIENFEGTLTYRCIERKAIWPWEVEQVRIREGQDLVTFSTCHPLGNNYQRFLAVFERVS